MKEVVAITGPNMDYGVAEDLSNMWDSSKGIIIDSGLHQSTDELVLDLDLNSHLNFDIAAVDYDKAKVYIRATEAVKKGFAKGTIIISNTSQTSSIKFDVFGYTKTVKKNKTVFFDYVYNDIAGIRCSVGLIVKTLPNYNVLP